MTLKDILGAPIEREEALDRIKSSKVAYEMFTEFSEKDQEDILGFIQGVKGLPILYDTFRKVGENISNKMIAWLTFLSSDEPEKMLRLVEAYPEFAECYHDIMEFRKKPEELITMFSEALIQMDRNTVRYMIEENQKELEEQQKKLEEQQQQIVDLRNVNKAQAARIAELEAALANKTSEDIPFLACFIMVYSYYFICYTIYRSKSENA